MLHILIRRCKRQTRKHCCGLCQWRSNHLKTSKNLLLAHHKSKGLPIFESFQWHCSNTPRHYHSRRRGILPRNECRWTWSATGRYRRRRRDSGCSGRLQPPFVLGTYKPHLQAEKEPHTKSLPEKHTKPEIQRAFDQLPNLIKKRHVVNDIDPKSVRNLFVCGNGSYSANGQNQPSWGSFSLLPVGRCPRYIRQSHSQRICPMYTKLNRAELAQVGTL